MIREVTIRNFQSLREAKLPLGTLTVILGQNDLGKSAVFRAIKAASEATPGVDFITYGEHTTSVEIKVEDHTLKWEKGTKVNRYVLDGVPFEKVGRSTPPEVADLLRTGAVEFDDDLKLNLNFADQDDPAFLIPLPGGISPSAVAKVLGDLTNLNILYRAVGEADTLRKRNESTLKIRRTDLDAKKTALESQFQDIPTLEIQATVSRTLLAEVEQTHARLVLLRTLALKKFHLRQRSIELKQLEERLKPESGLDSLVQECDNLLERLSQLEKLRVAINGLKARHLAIQASLHTAVAAEAQAEKEHEEILSELTICPLCSQPLIHELAIQC